MAANILQSEHFQYGDHPQTLHLTLTSKRLPTLGFEPLDSVGTKFCGSWSHTF